MARSVLFDNISGVYLYATLVSALPLYVTAIETSDRLGGLARRVAGRSGYVLAAVLMFGLSVLALTALAALIRALQT